MKASPWLSLRKQTLKEIMNTDILCEILHTPEQAAQAQICMDQVFVLLKEFESAFSRFQKDNELWRFNHSQGGLLSQELFDLLSCAQYFHIMTDGLFDPSILPFLEKEGYESKVYVPNPLDTQKRAFSELTLDRTTLHAEKPLDLMLDFGGIGKGYIIDRVAAYLSQHFDNFILDAGGDIYAHGTNKKENYPYWVVEIEHPDAENDPVALLLLKDMAVATSGRNRRHWIQNNQSKHHIIDPRTTKSASLDFLSVTVIAACTTSADILAKMLFISGNKDAPALAEKFHIPAIFVREGGSVFINHYAEQYVWTS